MILFLFKVTKNIDKQAKPERIHSWTTEYKAQNQKSISKT